LRFADKGSRLVEARGVFTDRDFEVIKLVDIFKLLIVFNVKILIIVLSRLSISLLGASIGVIATGIGTVIGRGDIGGVASLL